MKENYKKPTIYFENFELSQSIAAGCKFLTEDKEGSPIVDPELGFQVSSMGADGPMCSTGPGGDSICYHVPTRDVGVLSS